MPQLKSPDIKTHRSLYRLYCVATVDICQWGAMLKKRSEKFDVLAFKQPPKTRRPYAVT